MTLPDVPGGAAVPSPDPTGGTASPSDARPGRRDVWNDLDQSSIMSVELIAAILVWGGVGMALDRWWGTGPWLLGIGVLLGFGAGLYLIWLRSARELEGARPPVAAAAHVPPHDDPTEGR